MRKLIGACLLAAALGAAAPDPVEWKLVDGPGRPVKPGARFEVTLAGKIQPGWHIYSLKPISEGPTPTRIWISDGQPFLTTGAIKSSAPMLVLDPSFNMEVETYEGEVSFGVQVRVAGSLDPGSQVLVVNVSYQACDNKICLPPKTAKATLAIDITR